jgi:hypothetical protein
VLTIIIIITPLPQSLSLSLFTLGMQKGMFVLNVAKQTFYDPNPHQSNSFEVVVRTPEMRDNETQISWLFVFSLSLFKERGSFMDCTISRTVIGHHRILGLIAQQFNFSKLFFHFTLSTLSLSLSLSQFPWLRAVRGS